MITSFISVVQDHQGISQPLTQPSLDDYLSNIETKMPGMLHDYMNGDNVNISTDSLMVYSKSANIGVAPLLPPVKIGSTYFQVIHDFDESTLRSLYLNEEVSLILADEELDYNTYLKQTPTGITPNSFVAQQLIGAEDVYVDFGYTGEGVVVGIIDSGMDFGVSDLVDAAILSPEGYLDSFDVTGTGLAITTDAYQPIVSQGREYLPLEGEILDVFQGEQFSLTTTENLGIQLENLEITNLSTSSISGDYLVGMAYQGTLVEGLPEQFFLFVLVDSTISGVYDTIFVDMETSLAISLVQAGIILPSGRSFIQLNEYNLTNDDAFGAGNPIIAKDITGDGINDISMGGLGTVVDLAGVTGSPFVEGIDSLGRSIGMIYDPVGHGALVASVAASDGNTEFPLFDSPETEKVENATKYRLSGSAPDAKIIFSKAFSISDFILGWFWTGGLRLVIDQNEIVWEGYPDRTVDVSSNSWGFGNPLSEENKVKGLDTTAILLDMLSTTETLYTGYPGTIFVISSGNGAPGWGTVGSPSAASMAITVGASTMYHFLNGSKGKNDVAWFSSRGPTSYGTIKPDVVAPAHTGFVNRQVIQGYGNGTYAFGTFGGTSEAAPRVSGIVALLIEAFRDQGVTPTLGNVRLALKATATDLGFQAPQQGAGMVNAYKAVESVVSGSVFLSSTYTSERLGGKLQPVVTQIYGDLIHPLVDNPLPDPITVITPEQLQSGINLDLTFSNGTTIFENQYSSSVTIQDLQDVNQMDYQTRNINNEVDLGDIIPSNLQNVELLELSITMDELTAEKLFDSGLSTPNMTLYDRDTGTVVADLLSFNTWSQLLYAGNPDADFPTRPYLKFTDPGYDESVSSWPGMLLQIQARLFTNIIPSNIELTNQNGSIAMNSSTTFNEFLQYDLAITIDKSTYTFPIIVNPIIEAKYAGNLTAAIEDPGYTQAYSLSSITNTFDWGFRPESGEFRFYEISVPENATFLAVYSTWQELGLIPSLYLFNSTGDLMKSTRVEYLGSGYYETSTSELLAQNLLIPANDEMYYLMVQVTELPFKPAPFEINIYARYLDLEALPIPVPQYSAALNFPLSGYFDIDVSEYSIDQFPEFQINRIAVQVYQGINGTIENEVTLYNSGPNIQLLEDEFDDRVTLDLTQGSKVQMNLTWAEDLDADIYVFKEGDRLLHQNDLLRGLGTTPGNEYETVRFSADESGRYVIFIDYVAGLPSGKPFNYRISYETRDGPTLTANSAGIRIPTFIFPDGSYGLLITMYTNFDYSFQIRVQVSTENSEIFQFQILDPSPGETLEDDIDVSWSSTRGVSVDILLIINGVNYRLGTQITDTSYSFDSTIYPNGKATLRLEATDGIYQVIDEVEITISNNNPSQLPKVTKSDPRNLDLSLTSFLVIGLAISLIWRKNPKLRT